MGEDEVQVMRYLLQEQARGVAKPWKEKTAVSRFTAFDGLMVFHMNLECQETRTGCSSQQRPQTPAGIGCLFKNVSTEVFGNKTSGSWV